MPGKLSWRNPALIGTILLYGQSNMNSFVEVGTASPPTALPGTSLWNGNPADTPPVAFVAPGADGIVNLLNSLVTLTGKPWRAVNGSVNGTASGALADPTPVTGLLGQFLATIANAGVTSADLIFWRQGEGDSFASGTPMIREADYWTNIDFIHQTLATAMGKTKATLPFIISSLATNPSNTGSEASSAQMWSDIQTYLFEAKDGLVGKVFSHSNMDAVLNGDGLHEIGPANAQSGLRYAMTAKSVLGFGGGQAHFEISGATTIDAKNTHVTIGHASGATDWSGSTGFEVSGDNGATWATGAVTRVDASTMNIATSASLTTSNARLVRYQSGYNPDITSPIVDNGPLALPLTYTARDVRPVSLSTVPMPVHWDWFFDQNQEGVNQVATGLNIGPAASQRLVILTLSTFFSIQCTALITPNVGTAKTATVIQGTDVSGDGVKIAYAVLDSDADAATSVTVTLAYDNSPESGTEIDVWALPSASLNSTVPTASVLVADSGDASSGTLNIATSAGGFVIAAARNTDSSVPQGSVSGTESYALRYPLNTFLRTLAFDSSNNAANAASTITATYSAATGKVSMCAAAWR